MIFSYLGQRPGGTLPGRVALTAARLWIARRDAVPIIVVTQHSVPGHLYV